MFIINGKQKLANVTLLLTIEEAMEMRDSISNLLSDKNMHHSHVSSDDYQTEINVSILNHNSIESYHSDIRKIIGN